MKLLQQTIRRYFVYSLIVLLIIIPVFYFLMQAIVKEEIDEDLIASKVHITGNLKQAVANHTQDNFQFLDHDLSITKNTDKRVYDSFYTTALYDNIAEEEIPHRVLVSNIVINDQPYLMTIRKSMVDNDNLIEAILIIQVILLILLFAGLQLINRNLSKRIWKPFYHTLEKLRNYRVEDHRKINLSATGIHEFDDLNAAIEQLTNRSQQAYISQKEFAENASHEMQTPLAVFQSKLELLMQTSPLNKDQAELIGNMADASQRMNRLNKTLVLLSKIGNQQFPDKESIDINTVIKKLVKNYDDAIRQKNLTVLFRETTPEIITANITLVEILISNLLSNAIRHNQEGGQLLIDITAGQLQMQNTGKPSPLDKQKLFQRFYKESNENNGMGLGLELIKKIADLNNFSVGYEFTGNLHRFTIWF